MIRFSLLIILFIQLIQITGQDNGLHLSFNYNPDDRLSFYYSDDTTSKHFIDGQVLNIFNEPVDSVKILTRINEFKDSLYCNYDGIFRINLPFFEKYTGKKINLEFHNDDYKYFDTTFFYFPVKDPVSLKVRLIPKYKILLKGRIFIANVPLEDVDVSISHNDVIHNVKTLNCYYDDEDYWNCLYLGMFKSEIVTEDPEDSIYMKFSKVGYKSQEHKLKFADYSGELMRFRMNYADTVPYLPDNNLGLKIAWPVRPEANWFLGLSYYRLLKTGNFKRVAAGIEASLATSRETVKYETLPGIEENFDSIYVTGFAGPSVLLFFTRPYIRRFSTFAGCTFAFAFNNGEVAFQPFAGTRFFLDMNKSISLGIRYLSYHYELKRYNFNYLGQPDSYFNDKLEERLIVNMGLQICF